jgi:hypothetical protein
MTMTVQPIPLSKLIAGRAGTRRTGALVSIDECFWALPYWGDRAASI